MSEITGLTAQIGGGKSLLATKLIGHELRTSNRIVITNVPLVLENPPCNEAYKGDWTWATWAHEMCKEPIDLNRRLLVLSNEQAMEFWRYLPASALEGAEGLPIEEYKWAHGHCRSVKLPNTNHPRFGVVADFSLRTATIFNKVGVLYVIDEAHKFFPPMYYQKVGAQCEWYMSEMRKLDDDLIWITQHPEKVDKNWRRNNTRWLKPVNMTKTKLLLGVTFKGEFRAHVYEQQEIPTRTDKPDATIKYSLKDKNRWHELYKTMDGVGVSGGLPIEQNREGGRHWWVWIALGLGIVLGAYFAPRLALAGISKSMEAMVSGVMGASDTAVHNAVQKNLPKPLPMPYTVPATGLVNPLTGEPITAGGQSVTAAVPVQNNLPPPVHVVRPVAQAGIAPTIVSGTAVNRSITCKGVWTWFDNTYACLSTGETIDTESGDLIDVGKYKIKTKNYGVVEIDRGYKKQ